MGEVVGKGKIVTNGLVLSLDAADRNSYPGTGTTWSDVSGNNGNGTLVNGPTFNSNNGGSIVFDGSNDYVNLPGSRTFTTLTMIAWIRINGAQATNWPMILMSNSSSPDITGINLYFNTNNLGYHSGDRPSSFNFNSNLVVPDQTWCMVAYVQEPTQAVLYVNTNTATNALASTSVTLSALRIAIWNPAETGIRTFKGDVAIAMLYNRNLSSAEVLQNYNATKSRFRL
jgi:hypothetical protein